MRYQYLAYLAAPALLHLASAGKPGEAHEVGETDHGEAHGAGHGEIDHGKPEDEEVDHGKEDHEEQEHGETGHDESEEADHDEVDHGEPDHGKPETPAQPCARLCDLPSEIAECEDTLLKEQRLAAAAFTGAYADKDVDTMMSYVIEDYIQHNPNIMSGRDIAHKYIGKRLSDPGIVNNVTKVISDLNYIMIHVHRTQPGKKDRALADVYRFDGTCIAEHWDVQEDVEEDAPNPLAWF